MDAEKLPSICVLGRPNTGKSTISNRLTNSYKDGAIVHDEPGITRDRTYRLGSHNGFNYQVIDTGGMVFDDRDEDVFAEKITEQAILGLKEATCAVFVCDGQEGLTVLDRNIAQWLRKNCKIPLYLAINKCESDTKGYQYATQFYELGMGEPYPVSGIHGTGLSEMVGFFTSRVFADVFHDNHMNTIFVLSYTYIHIYIFICTNATCGFRWTKSPSSI